MKTKNNVRKAVLKSAAIAAGLALIGLTVNAQMSTYFENTGSNPMAMATEKTAKSGFVTPVNTKIPVMPEAFTFYLVSETEEPLSLEEWMVDESNFDNLFSFNVETDEVLKPENWMLNENRFELSENKTSKVETKEENKTISTATFVYKEVNEERALKVEGWMINPKLWGR